MRLARVLAVTAGLLCLGLQTGRVHADPITLAHKNSEVVIDPNSQAGLSNWVVDGTSHLYQQGLWFRVGNTGGQIPIGSLPHTLVDGNTGLRFVELLFADPAGRFSIDVYYNLSGGQAGGDTSALSSSIVVSNTGGTLLDFHLFLYSDFDMKGDSNGDRGVRVNANAVDQWKPYQAMVHTAVSVVPNHMELGYYDQTLNRLNDPNSLTLNDAAGPVGPGDVTWALEWDQSIAAGDDGATIDVNMNITATPEPASMVLLAAGAVGILWRRRKARIGGR